MSDRDLLTDLKGAVVRYLAAEHTSFVASYEYPNGDDATTDLLYRTTVELRDAAQAILDEFPR